MAGATTVEAIGARLAREVERGALDLLPAERASDGDAQLLTGDFGRCHTVETQSRHAARRIAREDAHRAQTTAGKAAGVERTKKIRVGEFHAPRRTTSTRRVALRHEKRRVGRARPDRRGHLGPAATRCRVID